MGDVFLDFCSLVWSVICIGAWLMFWAWVMIFVGESQMKNNNNKHRED